jgi:hypothetical protein
MIIPFPRMIRPSFARMMETLRSMELARKPICCVKFGQPETFDFLPTLVCIGWWESRLADLSNAVCLLLQAGEVTEARAASFAALVESERTSRPST